MCTITSPNMENGILVVTKIQIFFFPLSTPNEQHTGVLNGHDQWPPPQKKKFKIIKYKIHKKLVFQYL